MAAVVVSPMQHLKASSFVVAVSQLVISCCVIVVAAGNADSISWSQFCWALFDFLLALYIGLAVAHGLFLPSAVLIKSAARALELQLFVFIISSDQHFGITIDGFLKLGELSYTTLKVPSFFITTVYLIWCLVTVECLWAIIEPNGPFL